MARNAVSTAEKRPACAPRVTIMRSCEHWNERRLWTYEDEECINVVRKISNHVFIAAENCILHKIPTVEPILCASSKLGGIARSGTNLPGGQPTSLSTTEYRHPRRSDRGPAQSQVTQMCGSLRRKARASSPVLKFPRIYVQVVLMPSSKLMAVGAVVALTGPQVER